jgi:hypothetical protein
MSTAHPLLQLPESRHFHIQIFDTRQQKGSFYSGILVGIFLQEQIGPFIL